MVRKEVEYEGREALHRRSIEDIIFKHLISRFGSSQSLRANRIEIENERRSANRRGGRWRDMAYVYDVWYRQLSAFLADARERLYIPSPVPILQFGLHPLVPVFPPLTIVAVCLIDVTNHKLLDLGWQLVEAHVLKRNSKSVSGISKENEKNGSNLTLNREGRMGYSRCSESLSKAIQGPVSS